MATRAQEIYYESKVNKQNRDARNPIMESAIAGWSSGIERGLKSRQANIDEANKMGFKSVLDAKEQRIKLADTMITKYEWLDNGKPATPKGLMDLHAGIVSGNPDDTRFRMSSVKKDYSPYETESGKLRAQKEFGTLKDATAKPTGYTEKDWQDRVLALKDQLIGLGERTDENATQYDKYADEYQLATQNLNKVRGQEPTTMTPVQPIAQAPALPVETVKQIGNAALKTHYKYTMINPNTKIQEYSDDGKIWTDESGKQTQGYVIEELNKAGLPPTPANIEEAIRQLSGVK